jgi:EpsI family protein
VAPTIERSEFAVFPGGLGEWDVIGRQTLDPDVEAALGATDYYSANFASATHDTHVDVFMAWYEDQTRGGIHSPEVCLPGGGWEMAEIERVDMQADFETASAFPINRAIIQKGEVRLLVYYWFEQFDGRTASDFLAKANLVLSGVRHGRTDGALVRLITPLRPNEAEAIAAARLNSIVRPMLEVLPDFVPIH